MLKDEIEQVLKVMAKILSDISGISSHGQYYATIDASVRDLKNELNIDVNFILDLSYEVLENYISESKLSENVILNLADVFVEIGKVSIENNKSNGKLYLEKALELFDIVNIMSSIFSINRMNKIKEVKLLKDSF